MKIGQRATRTGLLAGAAVLAAGTVGVIGATAGPASADAATATACRDHLHSINGTDPNGHWPPYTSARTTSYCTDINVKVTTTTTVETCFKKSDGTTSCNGLHQLYANKWGLAATDVKDNTTFWLIFPSEGTSGVAAY
jgi:hypothetical protein